MSNEQATEKNAGTIEKDSVVSFHYQLFTAAEDGAAGELIESSFDGAPVVYLHGHQNIVRGLEAALQGRGKGEEFSVSISPEEGYGVRDENAVRRIPCKHVHEYKKGKTFRAGQVVTVQTNQGGRQVVILKAGKFNLDVDFNHPLAGETLYYQIKIEDLRTATAEEVAHGHVHGPGGHHH